VETTKNLDDFNMKSKKPWEVEGVEWREMSFDKLISKEKYHVGKVKVRNGLTNFGRIPVVDQGQELIRGYLDNEKLKYRGPLPLIIFGDHTKVIKFIDFPFIVGADGVKNLIPNKNLLYPKYFYWLLRKVKLPDRGYARHFKFLKQATYLIPFRNGKPDLETQKKIVEYIEANFSRIDKILEKKKKELEQLDELWESVLEQVFKPKEGEEWRKIKLKDIAKEIRSGGTPSRKNKEYWENGTIPWVKIQNISEEGYVNDTEEKITEKGLSNSSAKLLPKGTILFTIFATIGRVGILNIDAATNQAIAGIIPKKDYDRKYLYWVLRKFGEGLAQKGRGGAQNNVNLTFLKNLRISIPFRDNQPDIEKQKEIANYLDNIYEKIKTLKEKNQKQIAQLEKMKESILDEVFNHENK